MKPDLSKLDVSHAAPCHRCGERPEAYQCKLGVTVYHICGDAMSMAANYCTVQEAVEKWNELQEPKT